ncbi:MAG: GH3 auxin-responsive promoter family protein, partial [Planctomycetota bacterium]
KLAFLANWTGGTLGLHLRDFPRYFGDTPVRDIGLLATEGRVSIPLEDGTPAGVLEVAGNFFEFIDAEADAADASAVHRCHELVIDQEYRVVMTTSAGFYRYDIGDRVRVRGYMGEAPIVEFLHRGAHVSSVTGEKLTEWQVTSAFDRACHAAQMAMTEFVLAPVWADPPYYRLHLDRNFASVNQFACRLDEELSRLNVEYDSKRSTGRLGPIVVNRLPEGFFGRLDGERRGTSNEQYKHQYLYTKPGDDACLPLCAEQQPHSEVKLASQKTA